MVKTTQTMLAAVVVASAVLLGCSGGSRDGKSSAVVPAH